MKFKFAAMFAGILLFAAAPVFAGTITYNFAGPDVTIPSPTIFTAGGISIIARGTVSFFPNAMYQKDDGPSEDGLGLSGTSNNEINLGQSIRLDVSNLISAGYTEGTFTLGSLQAGEGAQICASTTTGQTCTPQILENGSTAIGASGLISFGTGTLTFITDNNTNTPNGNFLISELVASTPTTTPEPATLVLFGTALIGLELVSRRFRGATALR